MPKKKSNLSRKSRQSKRAAEARKRRSAVERELHLLTNRIRSASRRAAETPAQRAVRRVLDAERRAASRAKETLAQRTARRALDAKRTAALRAQVKARSQEGMNFMRMNWDLFGGSTTPLRKKLRVTNVERICNVYDDDLLIPTWVEAADGDVINELMDDDKGNSIVYDCNEDEDYDWASPHSTQFRIRSVDSGGVSTATNISKYHSNVINSNTTLISNRISSAVKEEKADDNGPFYDMVYPDCDINAPKNKYFEFCVHCRKRVPRIVHHYVNEHPRSEVYTSRIRAKDLIRVLTTENRGKTFTYKNGQIQYEALCIFCYKECKVILPYWFEHFTMHIGEYSYKCSDCDTLKPTRSLIKNYTTNQCTRKGSIVRKYIFEVCTICNYLQMHRNNILRHLKTQHEIETILSEHMQTVVLMQTVSIDNPNCRSTTTAVIPEYLLSQSIDSGGGGVCDQSVSAPSWAATNSASVSSTSLENFNSTSSIFNDVDADYTYNDCDDDDGDDLSYMICGMLDVATNDVNQTLDENRRRRMTIADAASNQDNSV